MRQTYANYLELKPDYEINNKKEMKLKEMFEKYNVPLLRKIYLLFSFCRKRSDDCLYSLKLH